MISTVNKVAPRVAAVTAALLALSVAPEYAQAASVPPARTTSPVAEAAAGRVTPPQPKAYLARKMHGKAALTALGTDLAEVAAQNDVSTRTLDQVLTEDHTAWLSEEGRLFYQEDLPEESTTGTPETAATVAPAYPTNQTFTLHSRPGSSKVIFLDFDGSRVANTGWNANGVTAGTYVGYDVDGSPSTFSSAEHGFIQEVWREVAESYAPFDVDVTTADPGQDALTRSTSADGTFGTRVLITSSATARQQACGSCLGVAYVGTFDNIDPNGYYQPAWVFDYNNSFDPMIVAQAAAHETGHTLGLSHDGTSTASYFPGTASWGPVMGSSMTRAVTQFSKGEYSGASNTQDDFAVMQTNGLSLRADDHGNAPAAAEPLGDHPSYLASGVIGTRTDTDVFAVTLPCTTTLSATAYGIGAQTALDLSLQVLDAHGTVVASNSPASGYAGSPPKSAGMNASVSIASATGTYYLRVDGVGNGSPANGGWSDYGEPRPVHADGHRVCGRDVHAAHHPAPQHGPADHAASGHLPAQALRPADRRRLLRGARRAPHRGGALVVAGEHGRRRPHRLPGPRVQDRSTQPDDRGVHHRLHESAHARRRAQPAAGSLHLPGAGLQRRRGLGLVLHLGRGQLALAASRPSARRTTAGSWVCHIGGRLARRKLP